MHFYASLRTSGKHYINYNKSQLITDCPLKAVRDCNHLLLFQALYVTRFTTHVSQRNIYEYRETCRVIRNTALFGQSELIMKISIWRSSPILLYPMSLYCSDRCLYSGPNDEGNRSYWRFPDHLKMISCGTDSFPLY